LSILLKGKVNGIRTDSKAVNFPASTPAKLSEASQTPNYSTEKDSSKSASFKAKSLGSSSPPAPSAELSKLTACISSTATETSEPSKTRIIPVTNKLENLVQCSWNTSYDVVQVRGPVTKRPLKTDLEYDEGRRKKVKVNKSWSVFQAKDNPFTKFQSRHLAKKRFR
jgi:hypothetical protein